MLKGTRLLTGNDAVNYIEIINIFRTQLLAAGYKEVIVPTIWETETFLGKIGENKETQMWTFKDRGDRNVCLIPEVTGIIQEMWDSNWQYEWAKPSKIFYVSKCFRYERPQMGRYREFTQIGVEYLGPLEKTPKQDVIDSLINCLTTIDVKFELFDDVTRGIGYYTEDGFEVECSVLGAQKQVAGGGRYKQGIGWAVGVDRLLLAKEKQ
jgi:histidyl-tRNA synthetase